MPPQSANCRAGEGAVHQHVAAHTQHHDCAGLGHAADLLLRGAGEVGGGKSGPQITQPVQQLGRPAAVAHHTLLVFPVALGEVGVDSYLVLVRLGLDFPQQLHRAVFHRVHAETACDAAVMALVILLQQLDIALQLSVSDGAVQRKQLVLREMDGVLGHLVDHIADTSPRA